MNQPAPINKHGAYICGPCSNRKHLGVHHAGSAEALCQCTCSGTHDRHGALLLQGTCAKDGTQVSCDLRNRTYCSGSNTVPSTKEWTEVESGCNHTQEMDPTKLRIMRLMAAGDSIGGRVDGAKAP